MPSALDVDTRVSVAFQFEHQQGLLTGSNIFFLLDGVARLDIFEPDNTVRFCNQQLAVRIEDGQGRAGVDGVPFFNFKGRAFKNAIYLARLTAIVADLDAACGRTAHDEVVDDVHLGKLDRTGVFRLDLVGFRAVGRRAADVERTHRQLRARLADRLSRDDADRHPFFDKTRRRQVHTVAQSADAKLRVARHRAADL